MDGLTLRRGLSPVYRGPCEEALQRKFDGYVFGEVRVSDFEIKTAMTNDGEFLGMLSARIQAELDRMACDVYTGLLPAPPDALDDCTDTLER